jgi:hypothetical protein
MSLPTGKDGTGYVWKRGLDLYPVVIYIRTAVAAGLFLRGKPANNGHSGTYDAIRNQRTNSWVYAQPSSLHEVIMDHTKEFFAQCDGLEYTYPSGHWYKIECRQVGATEEVPSGLKYSLAFFDDGKNCLVRFDNAHQVQVHGKPGPVAWDHWHRFSNGTLVPYQFKDAETLLADFFKSIAVHLP